MSDVVPRTLSVEELQPSSDDEEPVPKRQCTEPMKRCSKRSGNWQCKHRFPVSDPCNQCPKCRKRNKKYKSSDKGKASHKKYKSGDKGKATEKKYQSSDKGKAVSRKADAKYDAEHKEERTERQAEYRAKNRDKLNEKQKKRNRTLQHRFQNMLCQFGINRRDGSFSTKMQKLGFVDTEDLKDFFRRQFQPGMTFDNHGRQRIDGPRVWHIGHMIIPQYAYDRHLKEEQLRCFHKDNIAPQWADENLRQGTAMASDEVLLQYKYLWPMSWKGKLPSAQLRADIQGKRLNREANAYDTASDDSDFDFDFDDSDDEAGPSGIQTMPQDSDSD
jgi:hypothetical protein